MSERPSQTTWASGWVPIICNACDWRFFTPSGRGESGDGVDAPLIPDRCPHCAARSLEALPSEAVVFPYVGAADAVAGAADAVAGAADTVAGVELVVPFSISQSVLDQRVMAFADGIPWPPVDLDPAVLRRRLQRLYLPMWLVDSDVRAQWQAEVGFDYEVVSHQERYADGVGWQTEEVRETRVRWEPRVGQLNRRYENVAAPALTTHAAIEKLLGTYELRKAEAISDEALDGTLVRAPDRAPDAAWPEAEVAIRQRAISECRLAAAGDHLRDFRWAPTYADRVWTLLLLPVYATFYLDDEGQPQQVLIHGQTGQITGRRRGSLARAQQRSLIIGVVALVLFVLSLLIGLGGLFLPPLVVVGIVGALVALLVGIGAVVPMARVLLFNRQEADRSEFMA